jgi:uncharacterized protein
MTFRYVAKSRASLTSILGIIPQSGQRQNCKTFDLPVQVCKNTPVAVIDFHTHIFPPDVIAARDRYVQRDGWFRQLYNHPKARMASAEELIAAMDVAGVDASVTFGFAWSDPDLCRAANDYVIDAVLRWPGRLHGFAVVNPAVKGAAGEIERCLSKGLCGVGELMPDGQGYSFEDASLDHIIRLMTEHKRPVMIHAGEPVGHQYAGKSRDTVATFYQLALRHPDARLVAAHWGGGLWFYELMPEVQQTLRNVYYDTAASPLLYRDEVFSLAPQVVPHKVLFATDFPLLTPGTLLGRIRQLGLPDLALNSLLSGTALQLLHTGGA